MHCTAVLMRLLNIFDFLLKTLFLAEICFDAVRHFNDTVSLFIEAE